MEEGQFIGLKVRIGVKKNGYSCINDNKILVYEK